MKELLKNVVSELTKLLVAGKFFEAEAMTKGVRLSAVEIAKVVEDYGRQLVVPPEDAYESMDVIEVQGARPLRWSISMPLWTKEEGRSDLTLEITVIDGQDNFKIELDDIRVL